jgi:hypothetical protein
MKQAAMELYHNRPAGDRAAWLGQVHSHLSSLDSKMNELLAPYQQYTNVGRGQLLLPLLPLPVAALARCGGGMAA